MRQRFGGANLLLWLLVLSACGGTRTGKTVSEPPLRQGSALTPVNARYRDVEPSLNADGTRMVFLSGRDSSDKIAIYKAYKSDWPTGEGPGVPTRVTVADLGVEKEAVISPSVGQWVALVASPGSQEDLYLQAYVDANAEPVRVPDDSRYKTHVSFSPDEKLMAWISRTSDGTGQAKLVAIGDGSAAALQDVKAVSGEDDVRELLWVPTTGSYALVMGVTSAANPGSLTYKLKRFTTMSDVESAEASVLIEGFIAEKGVRATATASALVLSRKALAYERRTVEIIGDHADALQETKPTTRLESETVVVPLDGTASRPLAEPMGLQVVSLSAGIDTVFAVQRYFYWCAIDQWPRIGAGLVVAAPDGSSNIVVPRLREVAEVPGQADALHFDVVTTGFCDRLKTADKPEDGAYRADDRLVQVVANQQATATQYRLAYVSIFSHRFDGECNLLAGDPEIMVVDGTSDAKTVYPLSNNRAPLTSVHREPPCSL